MKIIFRHFALLFIIIFFHGYLVSPKVEIALDESLGLISDVSGVAYAKDGSFLMSSSKVANVILRKINGVSVLSFNELRHVLYRLLSHH